MEIQEGQIRLQFPDEWLVWKYDDSSFHETFCKFAGGCKGIDVIAVDPKQKTVWFIEIKDFKDHDRTKTDSDGTTPLFVTKEVAIKMRDTLAGLTILTQCETRPEEQSLAQSILQQKNRKIVLHLELPTHPKVQQRISKKLFPKPYAKNDYQKQLKQSLRLIDNKPILCDCQAMHGIVWSAERIC